MGRYWVGGGVYPKSKRKEGRLRDCDSDEGGRKIRTCCRRHLSIAPMLCTSSDCTRKAKCRTKLGEDEEEPRPAQMDDKGDLTDGWTDGRRTDRFERRSGHARRTNSNSTCIPRVGLLEQSGQMHFLRHYPKVEPSKP